MCYTRQNCRLCSTYYSPRPNGACYHQKPLFENQKPVKVKRRFRVSRWEASSVASYQALDTPLHLSASRSARTSETFSSIFGTYEESNGRTKIPACEGASFHLSVSKKALHDRKGCMWYAVTLRIGTILNGQNVQSIGYSSSTLFQRGKQLERRTNSALQLYRALFCSASIHDKADLQVEQITKR